MRGGGEVTACLHRGGGLLLAGRRSTRGPVSWSLGFVCGAARTRGRLRERDPVFVGDHPSAPSSCPARDSGARAGRDGHRHSPPGSVKPRGTCSRQHRCDDGDSDGEQDRFQFLHEVSQKESVRFWCNFPPWPVWPVSEEGRGRRYPSRKSGTTHEAGHVGVCRAAHHPTSWRCCCMRLLTTSRSGCPICA